MAGQRGYYITEALIYEPLNWDMDMIVSCLEVLRRKIPEEFSQFPKGLEYDLLSKGNPHGAPYPVIGIHAPNQEDYKELPDFHEWYDIVEKWVGDIGIENLIKEAAKIDAISWKTLEAIGNYPER